MLPRERASNPRDNAKLRSTTQNWWTAIHTCEYSLAFYASHSVFPLASLAAWGYRTGSQCPVELLDQDSLQVQAQRISDVKWMTTRFYDICLLSLRSSLTGSYLGPRSDVSNVIDMYPRL